MVSRPRPLWVHYYLATEANLMGRAELTTVRCTRQIAALAVTIPGIIYLQRSGTPDAMASGGHHGTLAGPKEQQHSEPKEEAPEPQVESKAESPAEPEQEEASEAKAEAAESDSSSSSDSEGAPTPSGPSEAESPELDDSHEMVRCECQCQGACLTSLIPLSASFEVSREAFAAD